MSARKFNVAIVGASGAVGPVLAEVLNERRFPVKQLKLLATARSAGKKMRFGGDELVVEETSDEALQDVDFAFISANDDASRRWAPVDFRARGEPATRSRSRSLVHRRRDRVPDRCPTGGTPLRADGRCDRVGCLSGRATGDHRTGRTSTPFAGSPTRCCR